MKTMKFLSVLVCLFLSATAFSNNNSGVRLLTNIENTPTGKTKIVTSFDEDTSTPFQKNNYEYDLNGNVLEKSTYKWFTNEGWQGVQKTEYTYDSDNKLTSMKVTKWDDRRNDWSKKSQTVNY